MEKSYDQHEVIDYIEGKYVYIINYSKFEEELCKVEMKYIFNYLPNEKYLFSSNYVSPSRSPFIKECIKIIYSENSIDDLITKIKNDNLAYDKFKVLYIKLKEDVTSYKERLKILSLIGFNIIGQADIHNPKVNLAICKINGKWIFGEYERNDYKWHEHEYKPYSYCNALGLRVSRALVNIAIGNDLNCTLIDPCCGIGTVVIEALSLNINVKGYELNESIGENAKENLKFLGFEDVITIGDMHGIKEKYDVSIVDMPYGVFSSTTLEDQQNIIKTARRISNKSILITYEDMESYICLSNFKVIDKFCVYKENFKRYIYVCI